MAQRITSLLVVCMLILGSGSIMAQPGKADRKAKKQTLKMAKEHLGFEEYQQAIPHIIMLLEDDPSNPYYNFWMGKSLYLTYKKNQALPYFEKVAKTDPEIDDDFHLYYALTLHYNHDYQRAIQEYRKELERHEPGSAEYTDVNNRIAQAFYAQQVKGRKEGELVKIKNLGESINTEFAEHSPVISANDSVLLYTARRPESLGAQPDQYFYDEDVYVSYRNDDGTWSEGKNISTPVNSRGHDATISLTADGKTLYIYRHKKGGGLYVTDFDDMDQHWREPKAVAKPLNSKYYETSISRSADGNILFFTSDRPGGYGGKDIYIVRKIGEDQWAEPENMGPLINTPFDEDAPYFHPDGKTLYYSSNGPNSVGGYDIFVTEWDSSMGGWLEPLNMGPPINTPDDEIYFVLAADGLSGYYASGKEGGFGEKDIYHIRFPYFRYPKRYYVIEMVGLVQDVQSNDTVPAKVLLVDKATGAVVDSAMADARTGEYRFELEPDREYEIEVIAEGYPSQRDTVKAPTIRGEDVLFRRDFLVDRPLIVEVEPEVELPSLMHLYYDFDKDNLRDESREELRIVSRLLKENPGFSVQVMSHTDWYGNYDYNVRLSEGRAESVERYLSSLGVPNSRIEKTWFSENKPLETNENDEGRQYNRRSELRILDANGNVILSSVQVKPGATEPWVDHTTPKGQPGYDARNTTPVATGPSSPEEDDIQVFLTGKDAVKAQAELSGKDEVKARLASSSGKDAVKGGAADDESAINVASLNGQNVHHIYFGFDQSFLESDAKEELQRVLTILRDNPELSLVIAGHTDSKGSVSYNQRLSESRTLAASNWLESQGISSIRLSTNGHSELKPISDNDSNVGRQQNRRVEFIFVRDGEPVMQSTP